jgi:hypothetical protein
MISLMAAGLMVAKINQHRFPAPAVLPEPYSTSVQDELPITPAGSASRCGTGVAASPCRQLAGMLQPDRFVEQHVAGGPHADAVDHAACCIWLAFQASSASSRSTGAVQHLQEAHAAGQGLCNCAVLVQVRHGLEASEMTVKHMP